MKVRVIDITSCSIEALVVSYGACIHVCAVSEAQGTGRFIQSAASDSTRAHSSNCSPWNQISFKTRQHSSKICNARLLTVYVLVATHKCQ